MNCFIKCEAFPSQVVQRARDAFESGHTRSIDFREQQLKQLLRMYEENTSEMLEALAKDLRKVCSCDMNSKVAIETSYVFYLICT
jgi:acyl-CoA reductase-like NAD-dependent aldehyde dehydrogenase